MNIAPHEEKKTVLHEATRVAQAELNIPGSQEAIHVASREGSKGRPDIIVPSHPAEGGRAAPNKVSQAASSEESKKSTQSEISKPVLLEVKKTVPTEPSKVPFQEMAKAIPQPIPPLVQPTVQAKTASSLPPKEQEMNLNKTNLPKPQVPGVVIPKQEADKVASMPRTDQMPRDLTPMEAFEKK